MLIFLPFSSWCCLEKCCLWKKRVLYSLECISPVRYELLPMVGRAKGLISERCSEMPEIICANNFQNSFERLFYQYIHIHVIGSTIPFLHSRHSKKSTLWLWIWYAVETITTDSDKITFVAKKPIEVSSTSTEVSFL